MDAIHGCLEELEVTGNVNQVFVKQRNLEFVVLQVCINLFCVCLLFYQIDNCINIELLPHGHDSRVNVFKSDRKLLICIILSRLYISTQILLKECNVWQGIHHLLMSDAVRQVSLQLLLGHMIRHKFNQLLHFRVNALKMFNLNSKFILHFLRFKTPKRHGCTLRGRRNYLSRGLRRRSIAFKATQFGVRFGHFHIYFSHKLLQLLQFKFNLRLHLFLSSLNCLYLLSRSQFVNLFILSLHHSLNIFKRSFILLLNFAVLLFYQF